MFSKFWKSGRNLLSNQRLIHLRFWNFYFLSQNTKCGICFVYSQAERSRKIEMKQGLGKNFPWSMDGSFERREKNNETQEREI